MELKELLEKAKARTITKEEVFEYFGVKNIEGLEVALAQKFDKPKDNLSYLDGSLQYIYATRENEDYSPIEENYMFYGIAAEGIYGVPMDEISILNGYFGPFKVLMMLDSILADKPEILFFQKLYKQYIARKEDMTYVLINGVKEIIKFVEKNLKNVDEKALLNMFQEFKEKANEIIKDKPEM